MDQNAAPQNITPAQPTPPTSSTQQPQAPQPTRPMPKSKVPMLVGLIAVLVLLLAGGTFFVADKQAMFKPQATPTPLPTTPPPTVTSSPAASPSVTPTTSPLNATPTQITSTMPCKVANVPPSIQKVPATTTESGKLIFTGRFIADDPVNHQFQLQTLNEDQDPAVVIIEHDKTNHNTVYLDSAGNETTFKAFAVGDYLKVTAPVIVGTHYQTGTIQNLCR